MKKFFWSFLGWFFGWGKIASIPGVHEAFFSEEVRLTPESAKGRPGKEYAVCFENARVHIFYCDCDGLGNHKSHSRLDICQTGLAGGVIVEFRDDKLETLFLNGHNWSPEKFHRRHHEELREILLHLRKICAEQNIQMSDSSQ